jgi:hypothetical protein
MANGARLDTGQAPTAAATSMGPSTQKLWEATDTSPPETGMIAWGERKMQAFMALDRDKQLMIVVPVALILVAGGSTGFGFLYPLLFPVDINLILGPTYAICGLINLSVWANS